MDEDIREYLRDIRSEIPKNVYGIYDKHVNSILNDSNDIRWLYNDILTSNY